MRVKIVEINGIVNLLTDKVNGTKLNLSLAEKMFDYRDKGYGIHVGNKKVLKKLNNYAIAYNQFIFINDTTTIPAHKLNWSVK